MDNTLYILRGVSGSGKTTLANTLSNLPNTVPIATDDFWYILGRGEYKFDRNRLGEAHDWCKERVDFIMKFFHKDIVLHNTNTTEGEIQPYLDLAYKYGYRVISLVVEKRHDNISIHRVPEKVVNKQASRLRKSIKVL